MLSAKWLVEVMIVIQRFCVDMIDCLMFTYIWYEYLFVQTVSILYLCLRLNLPGKRNTSDYKDVIIYILMANLSGRDLVETSIYTKGPTLSLYEIIYSLLCWIILHNTRNFVHKSTNCSSHFFLINNSCILFQLPQLVKVEPAKKRTRQCVVDDVE